MSTSRPEAMRCIQKALIVFVSPYCALDELDRRRSSWQKSNDNKRGMMYLSQALRYFGTGRGKA